MSGFDRQTPTGDEIYLDHVGWFIPDVNQASAAFERLGFILTPFVISRNADPSGGPPKPAGTGNRCAMLRRGYLELIASIDGVFTPLAEQHRAAVRRYVGLHVIAFTVADPAAARARLVAKGFDPGEPVLLRRPIQDEQDRETLAAFTVVRVPPEKMPEGRIQLLTQETPDLIWQERLIARANGITGLGGVLLSVDDPEEAAARYSRFTNRPVRGHGDYCIIGLDRGRMGFATPRRCGEILGKQHSPGAPSIPAVAMIATDPAVTSRFLAGAGIFVGEADSRVVIPPAAALGATVIVHHPRDSWPPNP